MNVDDWWVPCECTDCQCSDDVIIEDSEDFGDYLRVCYNCMIDEHKEVQDA